MASASEDETVKLWSLPEGVLIRTLEATAPLAVTPDGKLLVSGSADNLIKLWSLPDGETGGIYAASLSSNRLVHISHSGSLCPLEDLLPVIDTLRFNIE